MLRIAAYALLLSVYADTVRRINDRKIEEAVRKLFHSLHTVHVIQLVQFKHTLFTFFLFSPPPPPDGGNGLKGINLSAIRRASSIRVLNRSFTIDFISPPPSRFYHSRAFIINGKRLRQCFAPLTMRAFVISEKRATGNK